MSIFDDLAVGDDSPIGSAAPAAAVRILVVPEKAPTGQSMHAEEAAYMASAHIPQVVFESVDPTTGEVSWNQEEFREAMHSLRPVTMEQAMAWSAERVGAIYDAHQEAIELAEIEGATTAGPSSVPGAGSVTPRARMPHSTGRNRGQEK